jgi:predicted RNase H-like HicB family nuclease
MTTARYTVSLVKSDEGFSVWVPGLPGCASQGQTEEEALENISDAIREYLALRAAIEEGDVSGIAKGDVFARVRETLNLPTTPR